MLVCVYVYSRDTRRHIDAFYGARACNPIYNVAIATLANDQKMKFVHDDGPLDCNYYNWNMTKLVHDIDRLLFKTNVIFSSLLKQEQLFNFGGILFCLPLLFTHVVK